MEQQWIRYASGAYVLDLGRVLLREHGARWLACELIRFHKAAFAAVGEAELIEFGQGIDSWHSARLRVPPGYADRCPMS